MWPFTYEITRFSEILDLPVNVRFSYLTLKSHIHADPFLLGAWRYT